MFFKTKAERELDEIISGIEVNMSNNYKDNAQSYLRKYEETFAKMKEEGTLKGKSLLKYEKLLEDYQSRMKGYSHKDQKPYWT